MLREYSNRPVSDRRSQIDMLRAMSSNFDLMLELEEEYDCSGMCNPGLFYYGRNITEGPPKRTCVNAM